MENPKTVAPYDDSQWKAHVQAFHEYLERQRNRSLEMQAANRKEADRLKLEHEQYIERRRIENPYRYRRALANAKPLPLLVSKPIEKAPRRVNIEVLEQETGVSKRKKQSVFSPEVSAA
jgi:hypothetical protein